MSEPKPTTDSGKAEPKPVVKAAKKKRKRKTNNHPNGPKRFITG